MRAQSYDLNYLRTFRLDLKLGKNGCPIDQKCGKALCAEDIKKISNGEIVYGDYGSNEEHACDGINPFEKFSKITPDGDLVLPESGGEKLSKELNPDTDSEPVYIFGKATAGKSFVFQK